MAQADKIYFFVQGLPVKDDTDVMTPAQAAKYLKISTKAVYRMARAKKLPCIWIGKRARFSKTAIEIRLGVPEQKKTPMKHQRGRMHDFEALH